MENKRGSGIFLGVVSVATLVVAIIGATFAYFSASITGDNNVELTAYEFNASLSVTAVYPTSATNLVPMDPSGEVIGYTGTDNGTNLLYAMNEATNRCIDSNGFQVCAVYRAVFTNNGSGEITLNGTLKTIANTAGTKEGATGFVNLKYSNLTGTDTDNNLALTGNLADINSVVEGTTAIGSVTVPSGQTVTQYFVVYLDEQAEANNPEMGSKFTGQLIYTSATGGQQLTGTFDLSSPEEGE